jgi:hypothetical protein
MRKEWAKTVLDHATKKNTHLANDNPKKTTAYRAELKQEVYIL